MATKETALFEEAGKKGVEQGLANVMPWLLGLSLLALMLRRSRR